MPKYGMRLVLRKEIIQNIKQLLLEGSREILCWPVKEPLSLVKTKWNSLASLSIISLSLRDRFVKFVEVLNRLKKILPFELRIDIYRAFIALHFNYCSESWHHCGKRGCTKLEKINERALRFVTGDKSTTYETLLKQLNLQSPLRPCLHGVGDPGLVG